MNERIKKLAEQAGCSIDGMGYGEGNIEGLAELIVRECADRIRFCIKNDIDFIAEDIEKHFGVEE